MKMDRAEAKRRARSAAADIIVGTIEAGWAIDDLTDDGSEEQTAMIDAALREVAAEIRRRLPEGYELPSRPSGLSATPWNET
ncbi:hypothetical protein [Streptosporangium sp. NPDC087985]|uniref:hypothetical protein n=1 Tax=Streptosporangium sp. NPDC087985 TaxID=3366196 RepID=UPI00380FA1D2